MERTLSLHSSGVELFSTQIAKKSVLLAPIGVLREITPPHFNPLPAMAASLHLVHRLLVVTSTVSLRRAAAPIRVRTRLRVTSLSSPSSSYGLSPKVYATSRRARGSSSLAPSASSTSSAAGAAAAPPPTLPKAPAPSPQERLRSSSLAPPPSSPLLAALRALLSTPGGPYEADAFLVPSEDEHASEYTAPQHQRVRGEAPTPPPPEGAGQACLQDCEPVTSPPPQCLSGRATFPYACLLVWSPCRALAMLMLNAD